MPHQIYPTFNTIQKKIYNPNQVTQNITRSDLVSYNITRMPVAEYTPMPVESIFETNQWREHRRRENLDDMNEIRRYEGLPPLVVERPRTSQRPADPISDEALARRLHNLFSKDQISRSELLRLFNIERDAMFTRPDFGTALSKVQDELPVETSAIRRRINGVFDLKGVAADYMREADPSAHFTNPRPAAKPDQPRTAWERILEDELF